MNIGYSNTTVTLAITVAVATGLFFIGMWVQSINDSVKPIPQMLENQIIIMTTLGISNERVVNE